MVEEMATRVDSILLRRPIMLASFAFGILSFTLPIYAKRLGAGALEIGGLFSVFAIMTVLFRPLVGWGLDRFGRKRFFVAGLFGYACATALFAVASNISGLYLARLTQGLGSALMWIPAYTIAADLASAGERGRAAGGVDEAWNRGALYGALIGFAVLSFLPFQTGWRALFTGYAVLAAAGTWQSWRRVPETRPEPNPQAHAAKEGGGIISWRLLKLMVIVFVNGVSITMIGPLLMIFLQDKFTTDVGMLAMAFLPAALVSGFLPSRLGRLSDRFGRTPMMAAGLAGSGLVSLFMPGLPNMGWLVVLWALEAVGWSMAGPAEAALVADLTGGQTRGRGYGLYNFASNLGVIFGPLIGGWLYDRVGQATPFYLNGAVLLASAVWVLVLLGERSLQGKMPLESAKVAGDKSG